MAENGFPRILRHSPTTIDHVHVVEYDFMESKQDSEEVMVGFRYVYGLIHSNMPFAGEPWMSMEQCWVKEVRPYMPYLFIPRGQVV